MNLFVAGLIVALAAIQRAPDPLPRRGFFGVALEQNAVGVRVTAIVPDSTAAAAGIVIGDLILSIDGQATATPDAVIASIGRRRSGESVSISIQRNGESRTIQSSLRAYPPEKMQNATLSYGSVEASPGVRLRTIVSVPTTPSKSRYPAVLLVQGGGCGSVDQPLGTLVGQPELIHVIGSQGFITMRVEKSGVGDSEGAPCAEIGFSEELAGYQSALRALRSHPAVDLERVYLVGISLGGLFSPLLAAETPVAGIAIYGSPAAPTPVYPGRNARFFEEMAKVDVAAAWAKVHTRVLVLHGEYDVDPVIDRAAHQRIVVMVNNANPGAAQFREFAGMDHCWTIHSSLEASKDKCGQGQMTRAFHDAVLDFVSGKS